MKQTGRWRRGRAGSLRRSASVVWLLVALAGWPAPGLAEAAEQRLSLEAAVGRALAHYPSILASRSEQAAAAARAKGALAERRPAVSLLASATRFEEPMVVTPIHGFDPASIPRFDETLVQTAAEVSHTLYDGDARRARIRQAEALAEAAGLGSEAMELAVMTRTISVYVEVLGLNEVLLAHDRRLAALEAELARVRQLLDVGRAAEVERLRMQAAVAAARAEQVRLATGLDTAERELARWIGGEAEETRAERLSPLGLRGGVLPDRSTLLAEAVASSPEVERARFSVEAAEAAVALARSARLPELRLVGNFVEYGSAAGEFTGEWSTGARVSVPLYRGGATRARIAAAEAESAAAGERLRLATVQVAGQLDRALAGVEESTARVGSLEQAVDSFGEVARVEKLRLEVGSGVQTDYLDAEADLLAARAELARARHGLIAWRAELARVTGGLGLDWLRQTVGETLP